MDIAALDRLLNQTPVVMESMHPVSLAYLREPATVYATLEELASLLDALPPVPPHRALSFDAAPRYTQRFTTISVEHDPFTLQLNRILFDLYDFIAASMLTQAQVADYIITKARHAETVVLVLLDGLSYADCQDWPGVEPCLAAPPTVTHVGFPKIIGDPPLSARLFALGLTHRIGFTYWERDDEPLTNRLFRTIGDTRRLNPAAPNAFDQVINWLSAHDLACTYVQIVRSALDEYAEGHRTAIPRQAVIQQIQHDLEAVLDILQHKGRPAVLFAVADHGILWKDGNHAFEYVTLSGARHAEGRSGPGRGRCFEADGRPYWVLDYPQLGRVWHGNEQGVHGGISFEESIIPFIKWEVNRSC